MFMAALHRSSFAGALLGFQRVHRNGSFSRSEPDRWPKPRDALMGVIIAVCMRASWPVDDALRIHLRHHDPRPHASLDAYPSRLGKVHCRLTRYLHLPLLSGFEDMDTSAPKSVQFHSVAARSASEEQLTVRNVWRSTPRAMTSCPTASPGKRAGRTFFAKLLQGVLKLDIESDGVWP